MTILSKGPSSAATLFLGNLAYNVSLAAVIYIVCGGLRLNWLTARVAEPAPAGEQVESSRRPLSE